MSGVAPSTQSTHATPSIPTVAPLSSTGAFLLVFFFFFSSRRRHTRWPRDWSSDVCSSDLAGQTVSATMGAIDGRVTDNTDAALPGVTVTVGGPSMMGTRSAVTNEEGAYQDRKSVV